MEVIYEDNHLVVVNKAPGEIVQGDKTGDEPLSEAVARYLAEKYGKPGRAFVGVPHRLDRPVSGLVVLTRTSKALARMSEQFRLGQVHKVYWAVVHSAPPAAEGELVHYLVRNEVQNKTYVVAEGERADSQRAVLRYRLMARSARLYLLEVELLTGRHHQIRCQLAHVGCPIVGDLKYGARRSLPEGFIALHARWVSFEHPVSHQQLMFEAPPPAVGPWRVFAGV